MKRALEMGGSDGYPIIIPLSLKMVKREILCYVYFTIVKIFFFNLFQEEKNQSAPLSSSIMFWPRTIINAFSL